MRDEDVMEQFEKEQQEEMRPLLMVDADVKAKKNTPSGVVIT